ncbi:MAG TPA: sigma-70 family RNA polymerase sigma factor [Polyangiaceae bacterium]|nr:sigma-70 family RNA polymerase sigma factor [Polyangiaceae bacterium]
MELVLTTTPYPSETTGRQAALDPADVYREHADFVFRSLQHLGVRDADLEDLLQEVFVVVHRKLAGFDGRSRLSTWLFGICLRVASRHRRRAFFRFERPGEAMPERADPNTPEERVSELRRGRVLEQALGRLSLEQRAVFVLFELEGRPCQEIAELVASPLGTVYSRLHHARREIGKALTKAGFAVPGSRP